MRSDEAIYKMLVQVLENQRLALWAAYRDCSDKVRKNEFALNATDTEELLRKVMEK